MARLFVEIRAKDKSRTKEVHRIASESVEATLAVGTGNAYSHRWEKHVEISLDRDGKIEIQIFQDNKLLCPPLAY